MQFFPDFLFPEFFKSIDFSEICILPFIIEKKFYLVIIDFFSGIHQKSIIKKSENLKKLIFFCVSRITTSSSESGSTVNSKNLNHSESLKFFSDFQFPYSFFKNFFLIFQKIDFAENQKLEIIPPFINEKKLFLSITKKIKKKSGKKGGVAQRARRHFGSVTRNFRKKMKIKNCFICAKGEGVSITE